MHMNALLAGSAAVCASIESSRSWPHPALRRRLRHHHVQLNDRRGRKLDAIVVVLVCVAGQLPSCPLG